MMGETAISLPYVISEFEIITWLYTPWFQRVTGQAGTRKGYRKAWLKWCQQQNQAMLFQPRDIPLLGYSAAEISATRHAILLICMEISRHEALN